MRATSEESGSGAVEVKLSRQTEPDMGTQQHARKRKRKALSCIDCKRRKLKCDRIYPACGRCVKGGYPQSCQYTSRDGVATADDQDQSDDEEEHEEPSTAQTKVQEQVETGRKAMKSDDHPIDPRVTALLRSQEETISQLQNRIVGLERLVNTQHQIPTKFDSPLQTINAPQLWIDSPAKSKGSRDQELMLFRGKGFKTQFYGQTFTGSIIRDVSLLYLSFSLITSRS